MELNKFSETFPDVLISSGVNFNDERGMFKKTIYGEEIKSLMGEVRELLCVSSKQKVIRGLHFQNPPNQVSKFVTCIQGEIFYVFLDIRKNSNTYGKHHGILLNENDKNAIFIPQGFAHGYSVLSKSATVIYLQSGDYNPDFDCSINPLSIDINWHIQNPIISDKDRNSINFKEFKSKF